VAGSFARIGEWYAAHELEHVALDCYSLAAILDSTNATYRTCVDQLRLPALHRLDSEKE